MKIAVSGSSGLVGSALVDFLKNKEEQIIQLVRTGTTNQSQILWDPLRGFESPKALEGLDAVIHLAGENIAAGRWSAFQKEKIRNSRVKSTEIIARTLAALDKKPKVFVCASAIGFYGDREDDILDENSSRGEGFLAEVCEEWERATSAAKAVGIRVVNLRIGIVLSRDGGALKKMLPLFRAGLGGALGDGSQYMSWILLSDLVAILRECLTNEKLEGPVNAVASEPVTNLEFSKVLAEIFQKTPGPRAPAWVLKLAMGEMADALLLASTRVSPKKLLEINYKFQASHLSSALRGLLGPLVS